MAPQIWEYLFWAADNDGKVLAHVCFVFKAIAYAYSSFLGVSIGQLYGFTGE